MMKIHFVRSARALLHGTVVYVLLSFAAAFAARPGADIAVTPGPLLRPDLTPTKLYFTGRCDLMATVKNKGGAPFNGSLPVRSSMDGQTTSANSVGPSVHLSPGASANIKVSPAVLLGVWVHETHNWRVDLDYQNKIAESNDNNNSTSATLKCGFGKR
jgi:subtilase family serine protease